VSVAEPYRLAVAATAERSLCRLPEAVAAAVVEFIVRSLVESPRRLAHPLLRELAGLCSARRGSYRIAYGLDDEQREVTVLGIDHRAGIYRLR
jgi:mRNA interferase RelE/StbE